MSGEENIEVVTEPSVDREQDPGFYEGNPTKQETNQKHEPPKGSDRWNEVYAKSKESERKLEALEKKFNEQGEGFSELQKHNAEMMKSFTEQQEETKKTQATNTQTEAKNKIKELKANRRKARSDGDVDLADDYSDQIDELKFDILANNIPKAPIFDEARLIDNIQQSQAKEKQQQAFDAFNSEATWYSPDSPTHDPDMAAMAVGIESSLVKTISDPIVRLTEVKKRVEKRFKVSNPTPYMGPANSTKNANGNTEDSGLTSEEKRVASKMFYGYANPEKEYADQKKVMNKRKR